TLLGAHLQRRALIERVDLERPRPQDELVARRRYLGGSVLRPRPRQRVPLLLAPASPQPCVRIRRFVVEEEQAAGLERRVDPLEGQLVLPPCRADPEDAANDDRAVRPRRVELVQGLHEERRLETLARRPLAG